MSRRGGSGGSTRRTVRAHKPHTAEPDAASYRRISRLRKAGRAAIASIDIDPPSDNRRRRCAVLRRDARAETVNSVGCYVPGGRYPMVASAHMSVVTAKAVGTATIAVSAREVKSAVDVVIVAAEVSTIELDIPAEVRAGTRAVLSARALDRHGRPMEAIVRWTSRNPSVASVTDDGTLSAKRRGTAVVVAECGGSARATTITVMPAPVVAVVIDGVPAAVVVGTTTPVSSCVGRRRAADVDQERTFEWRSTDRRSRRRR